MLLMLTFYFMFVSAMKYFRVILRTKRHPFFCLFFFPQSLPCNFVHSTSHHITALRSSGTLALGIVIV
uniref:Putative secreted protein n=1 Tax=Ixodes ricinus TaxID=34613 RepID=A0A6B0U1J5_IXORI